MTSEELQARLNEALVRRLNGLGSMLFSLTWKVQVTPALRVLSRLVPSAHRTKGSAFTSWPSPNAGPQNDNDSTWEQRREELKAKHKNGNGFGMTVAMAAQLASWPTPKEQNSRGTTPKEDGLWDVAQLASWPTPKAATGDYQYSGGDHNKPVLNLSGAALLVGEATLTAPLPTASGPPPSGSPVGTASPDQPGRESVLSSYPTPRGQDSYERRNRKTMEKIAAEGGDMTLPTRVATMLDKPRSLNPALPRWLQGYPAEWDEAAIAAHRSMRTTRRKPA